MLKLRRLPPFHANAGKRLVKSPKVYVRDSGIVHALLGLQTVDDLLGHPVSGASWEGFVLESLLSAAPPSAAASFYRTAAGAEMDLVLELGGRAGRWAIEIKRSLAPTLSKGFHSAREDLAPRKTFVVYSGTERYPLAEGARPLATSQWRRSWRSRFANVAPAMQIQLHHFSGRRVFYDPRQRAFARGIEISEAPGCDQPTIETSDLGLA